MNTMNKRLFSIVFFLLSTTFGGNAYADCIGYVLPNYTSNALTLTVGDDVPINTVIGSTSLTVSAGTAAKCARGSYTKTFEMGGGWGTYSSTISKTQVEGVGVRLRGPYTFSYPKATTSHSCTSFSGCNIPNLSGYYTVEYIKMGNIPKGGETWYQDVALGNVLQGATYQPLLWIKSGNAKINLKGCTVTSNVAISLDPVEIKQFDGVGAVGPGSSDTLELSCPTTSTATLTIRGTGDSYDSRNVLAISKGASAATGVGYKLKVNDKDISLNTKTSMGTMRAGVNSIKFTANYIRTLETMTPGYANASATLDITYN